MSEILTRLRVDAGQLTLARLIQDREAAATEIERLREQLRAKTLPLMPAQPNPPSISRQAFSRQVEVSAPDGALLRASEVCRIAGIRRSTLYSWLAAGKFPRAVRISERSVRWRREDVISWRDRLCSNSG